MKYVITGCDGHLGGQVAENVLKEISPSQLIFTCPSFTRLNSEKKIRWESLGVTLKEADYSDPEGMKRAFEGGDRLYMISGVLVGEKRVKQHKNAVDAAVRAGIKHITYTSFIGASDSAYENVFVTPDHTATETYIKECAAKYGIHYNFMRNNLYMEDYLTGYSMLALATGKRWCTSAGEGKATFVPRDDSARLAAALLLGKGKDNTAYLSCGKESITPHEICSVVREVTGISFEYCPVDTEGMYEYFDSLHIPRTTDGDFSKSPIPWCSNDMVTNESSVRDGMMNVVSDDIYKITGAEPISAMELAEKNKDFLIDFIKKFSNGN